MPPLSLSSLRKLCILCRVLGLCKQDVSHDDGRLCLWADYTPIHTSARPLLPQAFVTRWQERSEKRHRGIGACYSFLFRSSFVCPVLSLRWFISFL